MSVHLVIGNIQGESFTILFEPYASVYDIEDEDHLELKIESADDSPMEVGYSPGCITLWLPTSVVSVKARNRAGDEVDLGLPF